MSSGVSPKGSDRRPPRRGGSQTPVAEGSQEDSDIEGTPRDPERQSLSRSGWSLDQEDYGVPGSHSTDGPTPSWSLT